MNKKANALANYLENSGMITGSSDSEFGKTTTLSISLPIERYCLLKELSSRFNVSMTQLVNISLNGFDEELLFSFPDARVKDIVENVDRNITAEVGGDEKVNYWAKRFRRECLSRDFEHFKKCNPNLSGSTLEGAYDDYRSNCGEGEYCYEDNK